MLAARLVAGAAALAVDNALSVTGLTRALETRDVIGQAKGILKERFSVDDRAAFALLVKSSQDTNIKLREVASLLADGSLGLPPRS
ncbi:ANTAR domain-containing protein [Actinomycetospora rhizophila]|uniref:ANTAR domain-containing protein n=1 Tax=Actinomycetospora rhizophila TaxID=1416876 RepID=A0ABV9ZCY3_9PSEU